MLYTILLSFMILVCVLMVLVILAQRSEGGALGIGSGPSGFMTARGAGNFLTKSTWVLGALFFICAILLIVLGNMERRNAVLDNLKINPLAPSALRAPAAAPASGATPAAPPTPAKPDLGDLEAPAGSPAPAPAPPTTLSAPPTVAAKPVSGKPVSGKPAADKPKS
jgi:preprotein translocase subunit SecG